MGFRHSSIWLLATGIIVLALFVAPAEGLDLAAGARRFPVEEVSIVVPASMRGDAALTLATRDLVRAISALGLTARVVGDEIESLPPYAVVLGDERNRWIAILRQANALTLPALVDEGYLVKRVRWEMKPLLVVSGRGDLGSVYGAFNLVEKLKLDPNVLFGSINVVNQPKIKLRLISTPTPFGTIYPSPEDALRWGFNAVAIEPWTRLPLYDGLNPPILDAASFPDERAWVLASRERVKKQIEAAKGLHLKVFTMGDVISFPSPALSILGEEVTLDNDPLRYCAAKTRTLQLLDHALDEVLTDFPGIDIIMVRTGENYVDGPITGNTPLDGACAAARDLSPTDSLRLILDVVRHRVVDVHGKTYIHRAWDLGEGGFHGDPRFAASVVEGVTPNDKFILSFKHTQTDFWRYNAVNPNFGRGHMSQMVEFQVAREYEGKGAFPNYLGEVFAYGGQEVRPYGGVKYIYDRGARAAWVWAKGGGWGGPEIKSDLWLDANTFAIGHLLWNPDLSPTSLALQWATLRFGARAAPKVASMLLKSDDAVLKGFYVEPYARQVGPWAPNNVWNRDDQIGGDAHVAPLYRASAGDADFASALAERKEALRIADSMITDFRSAMPYITDEVLARNAMNSLWYEKALLEVFDSYLTGLFHYYRWLDSQKADEVSRRSALESLKKWEGSWRIYQDIASLPGVASLYRDAGMSQAVSAALKELQ